jgi:hypothetical protein
MIYYYDGYFDGAVCYDVDGDGYDYVDYFDDNYAGNGRGYYYDGYYNGYVDAAVFNDFDGDGYDYVDYFDVDDYVDGDDYDLLL